MQTLIIGDVPKDFRDMVAAMSQEDFERIMGTPAEWKERLRQLASDEAFLTQLAREGRFPGEWVAVHDCEVLGHSQDWRELGFLLDDLHLSRTQHSIRLMPGA